jgi:predicted phosphohydrolase
VKINILSDLHLGFGAFDRSVNDSDVVILAGDISRPREAAGWAMRFDKPVLYVLGNHEFYGSSIDGAASELKQLCARTHVQVLDNTEVVIGGVRFLGTTLWTDFSLFGQGAQKATAMAEARRVIRDFSRIRRVDAADALFSPDDAAALFKGHAGWLDERLGSALTPGRRS